MVVFDEWWSLVGVISGGCGVVGVVWWVCFGRCGVVGVDG